MTTFLLIISFLLHGISLFALILLFQRQNNFGKSEKKIKQTAQETEEMLMNFLVEMKEENEKLFNHLQAEQQRMPAPAVSPAPESKQKEQQPETADGKPDVSAAFTPRKAAAKAYTQSSRPAPAESEPAKEESPVEQMVRMQQAGMTTEEIARQLHVGRTEVELALKFHKNEQK